MASNIHIRCSFDRPILPIFRPLLGLAAGVQHCCSEVSDDMNVGKY